MKTCKVNIDRLLTQQDKYKLWSLSYEQTAIYNRVLDSTQNGGKFDYSNMHSVGKNFRNEMKMTSSAKMSQNTVIRLINNWKSFLSLRKNDANARAPSKFASTWNFTPLIYDWNGGNGGFKFISDSLVILHKGKPFITFELPAYALDQLEVVDFTVADLKFHEVDGELYLSMTLKTEINQIQRLHKTRWLSIDPGVSHIVSMVSSDGECIKVENSPFKNLEKQISVVQSLRDKKKRGSIRYRRLKQKYRVLSKKRANKQKNFQHQVTADIIKYCIKEDIGQIFYGDSDVKSMSQSKIASSGLNKSTQNRGTLGRTKSFLQYKAGLNGIDFTLTNEAYTSKTNCYTGKLFEQTIHLGIRSVEVSPGLVLDRDVNAAINIAKRTLGTWLPQLTWLENLTMSEKYVAI